MDFRKTDPALPLHLRYRLPYYFADIPEHKAVYFQWNFIQDYGSENFTAFTRRLFADVDSHPGWKLIVDVRYDGGGDGSKDADVIKQIIKRDRFDRPGDLFVITGRKTFSAAVDFVGQAKQWTSAIFVGEPPGAGPNAYGDPQEMTAPNLKIPFQVSTNYHMYAASTDQSDSYPPDIPAIMTAADYFSGRDPSLDMILNGTEGDLLPLPALGVAEGGAAAKQAYEKRLVQWGTIPWWHPFSEADMNKAGYKSLDSGRAADAIVLFQMNVDRFPQSWNTWASLGDAQRAAGEIAGAKTSYEKSLTINPGERQPREALDEIAKTGR
ncbi:MAG TPA: hypothetical protein VHY79_10525 [Rhizomicrobium sp.]|nr:hypothetical protein [Rhizomicrobium sp.]